MALIVDIDITDLCRRHFHSLLILNDMPPILHQIDN
jgi:hypothetical protein